MPDNTEEKKPVSGKGPIKYRALVGLNYGDKRVEAGETVSDIPEDSVEWLLEGNLIEKVK